MRKANKTAIGAFVLGAMILFVIAIIVFGSGIVFSRADKYVLFFDGSVKGLSVGAPVIFRGVKIGNVSEINLVYVPEEKDIFIAVVIDVELSKVIGVRERIGYPDYDTFIKKGLKARLEIQNFITGQLMLAFDFHPDKPLKTYGLIKEYPELPALPISPDIFEIMDEIPIKEISKDLEEIVSGINKLLSSGGLYGINNALREVTQTARTIRFFVEYLEQHPEAFLKGKPLSK